MTRIAVLLALILGACRCGEPEPEPLYEVGTPLVGLPASSVAPLGALVPTPVLVYGESKDPAMLLANALAHPRVVALQKTDLWREISVTDTGAAVVTLWQRVQDLARLPVAAAGLKGLFDGPAAMALRSGAQGTTQWMIVKAITPTTRAALDLAATLQSVHASEAVVRVERYRGLPLRKVRLSERERAAYYVIRDRLVLSSDETWLKASLDLALGRKGGSAAERPMVATAPKVDAYLALEPASAISESTQRLERWALPFQSIEFARLEWSGRLELAVKGPLSPSGARLMRLVPKGTLVALALGVDAPSTLKSLTPPPASDAGSSEEELTPAELKLFSEVRDDLAPLLGPPSLFAITSLESTPRPIAIGVVATTLSDRERFERVASRLQGAVLAKPPIAVDRIQCVPVEDGLCGGVSRNVVAVSNRPAGVRAVLPTAEVPASSDTLALLIDVDAWVSNLDRYAAASGHESADTRTAIQKGLAPFAGVGRITCNLTLQGDLHRGDVSWR